MLGLAKCGFQFFQQMKCFKKKELSLNRKICIKMLTHNDIYVYGLSWCTGKIRVDHAFTPKKWVLGIFMFLILFTLDQLIFTHWYFRFSNQNGIELKYVASDSDKTAGYWICLFGVSGNVMKSMIEWWNDA